MSRVESHGKRLLDRTVSGSRVLDDVFQQRAGVRAGKRIDAPLSRHVVDVDVALAVSHPVIGGFLQEIIVIGRPGPGGDQVVFVLFQPDDGVFGAGRAVVGQGVGQVDPAHVRQLVAGEVVKEGRRPRPADKVLGEGRSVDDSDRIAHGFRLGLRIRPPGATAEAAAVVVEVWQAHPSGRSSSDAPSRSPGPSARRDLFAGHRRGQCAGGGRLRVLRPGGAG